MKTVLEQPRPHACFVFARAFASNNDARRQEGVVQ